MKVDDKIIQYDISKHLPKSTPNEAAKVDEAKSVEVQKTEGKESSGQDAIVQLSSASKEVQRIRDVIASEPDVRADKVAELKERIQSGQYEIDHDAVAEKMVDELIDKL